MKHFLFLSVFITCTISVVAQSTRVQLLVNNKKTIQAHSKVSTKITVNDTVIPGLIVRNPNYQTDSIRIDFYKGKFDTLEFSVGFKVLDTNYVKLRNVPLNYLRIALQPTFYRQKFSVRYKAFDANSNLVSNVSASN